MDLHVDPERLITSDDTPGTGIYLRAQHEGRWGSYDLCELDNASVEAWFKGLHSEAQVRTIMVLLGRG